MVLKHCAFTVSGRVQGVFFRKYTQQQASTLGLVGWVQNTADGSVIGELEGPEDRVEQMKTWLRTTGSPNARIDNAEFRDVRDIEQLNYSAFEINR